MHKKLQLSTIQAVRIGHVNHAVSESGRVIQKNAGDAQEMASAFQEVNAQAQMIRVLVGQLTALIGKSLSVKSKTEIPSAMPGSFGETP